jgi:hypothetical protein
VLRLFHEQLASCRFLPVRRVGEVYVVVEPSAAGPPSCPSPMSFVSSSSQSFAVLDRPGSPTPAQADLVSLATSEYRLPYWAVLRVRLARSAMPGLMDDHEHDDPQAGGGPSGAAREPEDDVLMKGSVSAYEVAVALHHPPAAEWYPGRQVVMDRIKQGVLATCCHVNQLLLLNHLHDTRQASSLLIAPTDSDLK